MPYLGREPQGILANTIEGNLKVTGTISADSINDKLALNGSDTSSPQSNANDQIVLEAGTLDDSTHTSVVPAMAATDNLLLEDVTPSQAEVPLASISAAGTSGQFLQSQGSLVAPTFSAVSQAFTFISKSVVTEDVSEVIVQVPSDTYNEFVIVVRDIHTKTDGITRMRWSNDSGTTFTNQNYGFHMRGGRGGGVTDDGHAPDAYGPLGPNQWNNSGAAFHATIDVTTQAGDQDAGQREVTYRWTAAYTQTNSSGHAQCFATGATSVVAPGYINAFEISNSGGDLERGTILLYGLAES